MKDNSGHCVENQLEECKTPGGREINPDKKNHKGLIWSLRAGGQLMLKELSIKEAGLKVW